MRKFLFILAFSVASAYAVKVLAVLEIIPTSDDTGLSISEMRHLTDELRRQAVQALPDKSYTVLTRDNILSLMPPDEKEAKCLEESCAIEIGRAIGAEYVSQGSIGRFSGLLTISIELYESMSGNLLGSIVMESTDKTGLLTIIREQSPGLFVKISPLSTSQKSDTPFFVALSLDILGAAALGYGIYQHVNSNRLYDKYKKMPKGFTEKEYNNALSKANDSQRQRNIGYTVGAALLAAGIGVHIWF